jgi:glycosyltransferase involved in cell wall biosynthesis
MLFHTYGVHNQAIWNAMQLHVHLILQTGKKIVFLVHVNNAELVRKQFPKHQIISYKSYFDLIKILISSNERNIFTSTFKDTLLAGIAKIFKPLNIYYWVQGIEPEESYMRNHSSLRKSILSFLEKCAIRLSAYQILVSPHMKQFLSDKYRLKLNPIIIPCTSDLTYHGHQKIQNSFTYVGGMAAWQRFDTMLEMFNRIAILRPDAHFYVATGALEKANEIIKKHLHPELNDRLTLQSINDRETMEAFLNTMEYGFLIREDDPVNNVSSPIKLAEYLSCGVNVVISSAVSSYAPLVEEYNAGISVERIDDIEKLQSFTTAPESSLKLYCDHFNESNLVERYKTIL